MTTNFSHTANVGRVEEMNWPKLESKSKHQALVQFHACCIARTQEEIQIACIQIYLNICYYRSRSYGLGKACSSKLRTLQMAAMVGWESDVSLRVRSSLGIS